MTMLKKREPVELDQLDGDDYPCDDCNYADYCDKRYCCDLCDYNMNWNCGDCRPWEEV